jgi:hypothetical protein
MVAQASHVSLINANVSSIDGPSVPAVSFDAAHALGRLVMTMRMQVTNLPACHFVIILSLIQNCAARCNPESILDLTDVHTNMRDQIGSTRVSPASR